MPGLWCSLRWDKRRVSFQTTPRGYEGKKGRKDGGQIFTLHVFVEQKAIPVVYAVMPDKRKKSYKRLFRAVREVVGEDWAPELLSDFEDSSIRAFQAVSPDASELISRSRTIRSRHIFRYSLMPSSRAASSISASLCIGRSSASALCFALYTTTRSLPSDFSSSRWWL